MGRPVVLRRYYTLLHGERLPGRQFLNLFECGSGWNWEPEGEDLIQSDQVQLSRHTRKRQKGFYFRCKSESFGGHPIKQRPYAETVAGKKKFVAFVVPNCEGPLSVEFVYAVFAEFCVRVKNNFRIRQRRKSIASANQLLTHFDVIEDFAIERNPQ